MKPHAIPDNPSGPVSLLAEQAAWVERYRFGLRLSEQGELVSVGDGIARVRGLPSASMDAIISFEDGSEALVFDLSRDSVGAILLRQTDKLAAGAVAQLSGDRPMTPAGDVLRGRIIDPLGRPLDGLAPPETSIRQPLDVPSPPITVRDVVREPLYTGNKIIDTLIPIGKGQRELIVGDDGLGKSSLAIDTVINQRGKDVYCVCVMIGQRRSSVVNTLETLRRGGAMEHTTVVVAEATDLPGLKYLAPFAGCALAEASMAQGRDTLVIYDDLTTHAQTYRELSLLLRRPPGREAYPGDIFFLHSRLLERSTCLAPAAGGGSMTALPIIVTKQGEIAAYIPTNLISITDGQIYLDRRLFAEGFLPAIDVPKSVSRIGGRGQHPRISAEAARVKLDYLQFLELEVFTRLGARLEATMEARIRRGRVLRELLKQDRLSPLPVEFEMAWLVAYNEGLLDRFETGKIPACLEGLQAGLKRNPLALTDSRERWVQMVGQWLAG